MNPYHEGAEQLPMLGVFIEAALLHPGGGELKQFQHGLSTWLLFQELLEHIEKQTSKGIAHCPIYCACRGIFSVPLTLCLHA